MPDIKNGGIYFKGVYRDKLKKQKECHIGTYGKGVGQLTLKQARERWDEMKKWSSLNKQYPHQFIQMQKDENLGVKRHSENS